MADFDLAVVGGGPAGYVAAIRAAQLGFRTALVEEAQLGGICLNWGCIPTKALLSAADALDGARRAGRFGIAAAPDLCLAEAVAHSRRIAERLRRGVAALLEKNGVELIEGRGRLAGKGRLEVATATGPRRLSVDHLVLATGARPRALPGVVPDGVHIWTAREAMTPQAVPESLLVVGAGAIGAEFASFYADLGTRVTLVEVADRILPGEDREISALVRRAFTARGIEVRTGVGVVEASVAGEQVVATLSDQSRVSAERLLLAVGVQGNVEDLGLEGVGAKVERGFLVADAWGRTNVAGLYGVGDLVGPPWLAHKASRQGILCVERIAGVAPQAPLDLGRIPACTYCRPQVASLGLTEERARAGGRAVRVGRARLAGNGKALAAGEEEGLAKLVFDAASGELLGAHLVGPEVTELISALAVAAALEGTEEALSRAVLPHPTLSEWWGEAVLDALGRPIHH
ncbi:MAG: dihydrolipoyl dehydrogenase [Porticoccaceae bacterium]|nr:MAG: dihydrolipoyl dehydrogenase [Porticoccaceae bacterium]